MAKKEDIMTKFWKDYNKADFLEREKMIDKTRMVDSIIELVKSGIEEKYKKIAIKNLLRSYFDDCIEVLG